MIAVAIVDGDASVLDAAKLFLEGRGCHVRAYATGEAFLEAFERNQNYDCVLLDPHLPGISGVDVSRAMADSGVPFLVFTARPDSALTAEVAGLGAKVVVTKPVSASELLKHIHSLVHDGTAS